MNDVVDQVPNLPVNGNKNHGFNQILEELHRKPEDWLLGAAGKSCIALIPNHARDSYLPAGEVQAGKEDTMDCASRSPVNIDAMKFNWLVRNDLLPPGHARFVLDNGYADDAGNVDFSDAFVAINSGTTTSGNSLIAPLEAIRTKGLIPKHVLPLEAQMTWEDYHNPKRITRGMTNLGRKFAAHFRINYERIRNDQFDEVIEEDAIDVGGYAWPHPEDGEYLPVNAPFNHSFILYRTPRYRAFDNYPDSYDGDFIKRLSPNYLFTEYGYRVIISLLEPPTTTRWYCMIPWLCRG